MSGPRNLLLRCLSSEVLDSVGPRLSEVKLTSGKVLAEANREVVSVYFPNCGAVSLVVEMSCGDTVETALIGRDGAVNALAALDHKLSLTKACVLLPGTAMAIDADQLRECCVRHPALRELLARHVQVLLGEIQQAAACNILDGVEARLARWLLRARDLVEADEIPLTQEAMAQMLGVRRPTVSTVAAALQREGFIEHRRGHVRILDSKGLEDSACECYATIRGHYRNLLSQ